jgi:RNA-directed DNA polymerase
MHYTFDKLRESNRKPWARDADDAVIHCHTKVEAERLLGQLRNRFNACKLELHPDITRIVYCKDDDREGEHSEIKFDFLGVHLSAKTIEKENTSSTSRHQ